MIYRFLIFAFISLYPLVFAETPTVPVSCGPNRIVNEPLQPLPNTQTIEVDGRVVSYACIRNGSPTVVFESGLGDVMGMWGSLYEQVGKETTVFAYNRPGYGASTIGETPPKSAQEVAQELYQDLQAIGLKPPYLLAAHSFGGLYANMFARTYQKDVGGVVLIDSSSPVQFAEQSEQDPVGFFQLMCALSKAKFGYEASIAVGAENEFKNLSPNEYFPDVPLKVLGAQYPTSDWQWRWP